MDEDQEMERFDMQNDYEGGLWIGDEFYCNHKKQKKIREAPTLPPPSIPAAAYPESAASAAATSPENPTSPSQSSSSPPAPSFPIKKSSTNSTKTPLLKTLTLTLTLTPRVKLMWPEAAAGAGSFKEVGKFENHTRGIGLKLMEKMGYKMGTGLGKSEQGITVPVEAKLRPKGMGMGFNDYAEAKLPALDEAVNDGKAAAAATVAASAHREKRWLRQKQGKKKVEFLTAVELLAKKQVQGLEVFQQKILDMRGPQARVLANLENLNAEVEAKENQVPMPELQHNVRLIVDMAESDILKFDNQLRRERENKVSLEKEKKKLQKESCRQKQQLEAMETIAKMVKQVDDDNMSGILTLESLLRTFSDLKERFAEDYKLFNVSCIACSFAIPQLIRVFQGWEPLQNPSHGLAVMSSWRDLLQGDQPFDYSDDVVSTSPYAHLVGEVILPAVRISGTNSWQARDPEPMLRFVESWEKLLPPVILQSILEHVIMPKLSTAVDSWDPRRETVPIHAWIHPWLPLLGQRLEDLYHKIRFKLGNVLHAWHASDASAYAILSPWKDVFDAGSWENLIVRFIVPKLMNALQEFQINPANQILDQFNWVMTWASVIPIQHLVNMLEVGFFSKWQQVLYHWLSANPDFNEVMQWYMGWKGLFPPELLANERIRLLFNSGLSMMNQASEGMELVQPGARENSSYIRVTERRQFESQQTAAYSVHLHTSTNGFPREGSGANPEMSLKEIVEDYAVEQGLIFVPKVGRSHNGLPVYGFGNISICIDSVKEVLYAQGLDGWDVVSLNQLIQMQHTSKHR